MNGRLMPSTRTTGPARGAARRTGAPPATATRRDFFWGSTPSVSLRHTPDPVSLGLAPAPVTGVTIVDIVGAIARPMRPADRVQH